MLQRRPFDVVANAVAHRLARIALAMAAHGQRHEQRWVPGCIGATAQDHPPTGTQLSRECAGETKG